MTAPFRTSGLACPRCAGASLRAYRDRLVCDECQGMLLAVADLTATCEDAAGVVLAIELHDAGEATATCPRCTHPMIACRIDVGPLQLDGTFLRCAQDGVWIAHAQLMALFARLARRWPRASGSRRGAGSKIGPDGLAVAQHAAGRGLRISERRHKPRPRDPVPPPSDPYAHRALPCPVCRDDALAFRGDRWSCARCDGTFVANAALAALVAEILDTPWEVPETTGLASTRSCPVCMDLMRIELLEGVEIDRCEAHGSWFDPAELGATLERAAGALRPAGFGAWLRRLFG